MSGSNGSGSLTRRMQFLECRKGALGHAWDTYGPEPGYSLSLLCARCGTRRWDDVDAGGAVASRRYVYPPEYKLTKDERAPSTDIRLELMARVRRNATAKLRRGQVALLLEEVAE